MYLELHSIYGIVEFKPKSLPTLQLLESIRDNFQRLEALGPIEQASAPESEPSITNICTSAGDTAIDEWLERKANAPESEGRDG